MRKAKGSGRAPSKTRGRSTPSAGEDAERSAPPSRARAQAPFKTGESVEFVPHHHGAFEWEGKKAIVVRCVRNVHYGDGWQVIVRSDQFKASKTGYGASWLRSIEPDENIAFLTGVAKITAKLMERDGRMMYKPILSPSEHTELFVKGYVAGALLVQQARREVREWKAKHAPATGIAAKNPQPKARIRSGKPGAFLGGRPTNPIRR